MFIRSLLVLTFVITLIPSLFAREYQRKDSTSLKNGCRIIHIQEDSIPLDIYVLEVDLTNKKNRIKTGLANDKIAWIDPAGEAFVNKETLGHMVERRTNAGETVIGGINADFFNMANGMQFNVTATNSEIASTGLTPKNHAALYTDESGVPYIGTVNLEQKAILPGIGQQKINGINIVRKENFLVIYNRFTGQDKSFANEWGVECLLEPLDSGLINGVRNYKILEKAVNVTIKANNQIILSGIGTGRTFLDKSSVGQIIQINSSFANLANKRITEMVGGWGHIVKKGENCAELSILEEGTMYHENDRHPRTAAGFNKEKTKMYLVAVDGRSDISKGINLTNLAEFMINQLNVWEGLNFDGGGSTTLMAGDQTINTPSGGVHRAITNALLVVEEEQETQNFSYDFETQSSSSIENDNKIFFETDAENRASVWVLEVDRAKAGVQFAPVWAYNQIGWSDAFGIAHKSEQTLCQMMGNREQNQDTVLIGAINASPFNFKSDAVCGLTASNGMVTTLPDSGSVTPAIWFNEQNEPFISMLKASIKVETKNGAQMPLDDVNGVRWIDNLVLYNSFIGAKTNTNQWGAEVLLEPQGALFLNGTQCCSVTEKVASLAQGTGKMPIGDGQFVLSGNTKAFEFIRDNINVGDSIQIHSEIEGANGQQIKHIISGAGILLKNGELFEDEFKENLTYQPVLGNDLRSAIAYNTDKSKVFLFASDEFGENNLGLSLKGLSELMKKYGVADGLILDGGNSTSLFAGEELININSENEAAIPNGIVIEYLKTTASAAIDQALHIRVFPNPATGHLFVEPWRNCVENTEFKLYNSNGLVVVSEKIKSQQKLSIDISEFKSGIYFFQIYGDEHKQESGKLIINRQ